MKEIELNIYCAVIEGLLGCPKDNVKPFATSQDAHEQIREVALLITQESLRQMEAFEKTQNSMIGEITEKVMIASLKGLLVHPTNNLVYAKTIENFVRTALVSAVLWHPNALPNVRAEVAAKFAKASKD